VRDKQVKQTEDTIGNFVRNGISSNLLLQGVTGSGKTSTLAFVLRKYDKRLYTFVRCKKQKGVKDVLAQIGNLHTLARQRAPELLPKVIENLQKDRKVVILDDVTQVASWQELMNYLDGIYRAVQTPIFVTTNVFQFLDKLPEDVRHTLLFFRVDFGAYNVQELFSIVKDRVDLSGAKIPVSALKLIAALTTDMGSARDALTMTRTAIQLGKTTEEEIKEMKRTLEEQTYLDYLNKLAPKEHQVLNFIVQEFVRRREPIPVRDVSKALKLSPSRTSQLITGLEQYDIIATVIHRERGNFRVARAPKPQFYPLWSTGKSQSVPSVGNQPRSPTL
jgi:Cdc6-like AAA superfamily ATPase